MSIKKTADNYQEEHELMMHVMFGNKELNELGMKDKVDAMYKILTNVESVSNVFGTVLGWLKWLLIIAAITGVVKAWWGAAVMSVFSK